MKIFIPSSILEIVESLDYKIDKIVKVILRF